MDLERGRPVAVKILPLAAAELRHDAKREVHTHIHTFSLSMQRTDMEAGAQVAVMKKLRHSNVVRLFQV